MDAQIPNTFIAIHQNINIVLNYKTICKKQAVSMLAFLSKPYFSDICIFSNGISGLSVTLNFGAAKNEIL